MEALPSCRIVCHNLPVSEQTVLVRYKPLQSHRASGMKLSRADANLGSEAVAIAVRKPCGAVPVYAGTVHPLHKVLRRSIIRCQNRIGMMRAEAVDVLRRLLYIIHQLDGNDKIIVLHGKGILCHNVLRCNLGQDVCRLLRPPKLYAGFAKSGSRLRQKLRGNLPVYEERLHGIAGRRVLCFGIDDNRYGRILICLLIHIDVADSARMSHDRYLCVLHDIADESVGAARDQKIHVLIAGQELIDFLVLLRLKQTVLRQAGRRHRLFDHAEQNPVGFSRLLAAL